MKNKILFISHEASRTGAPLVLLHFLKWIKTYHPDTFFGVLLIKGGVLEHEFNEVADKFYHYEQMNRSNLSNRIKSKLNLKSLKSCSIIRSIGKENYNLIYANTANSVQLACVIKKNQPNVKCLAHIHEMQAILELSCPKFKTYTRKLDHIIAVSNPVYENLINNYNITKDKISIIYEFGITQKLNKTSESTSNVFRVGTSGLSHWRKGNDVFLQVARYVKKHHPELNIEFVWVGNEFRDKTIIDKDIQKMGLESRIRFTGELEKTAAIYNSFDLFLLSSREDPFPLVCIEVAQLKKPIICFEYASGTADIISKGGGYVVSYLDIEAVVEKIVLYYNNPDKKIKDGEDAFELFKDFTPEKICPLLFDEVLKLV